jgi:hypothetical protein
MMFRVVFWDILPTTDVSEVRTATIIRDDDGGSTHL